MQQIAESNINYRLVEQKFEGSLDTLIMTYLLKNLKSDRVPFKLFIQKLEAKIIQNALVLTGGSQKRAAAILGIKTTTFHEKFHKYNLNKELDPTLIIDRENANILSF